MPYLRLSMFEHVLVESTRSFQVVGVAIRLAALVGKLLFSARTAQPVLDGGAVAKRALLALLLLDLRDLHCLDLLHLVIHRLGRLPLLLLKRVSVSRTCLQSIGF